MQSSLLKRHSIGYGEMCQIKLVGVVGLFILFYYENGVAQSDRDLETKVALLLEAEHEALKCFAGGRSDFTCFWEANATPEDFTFLYTYQHEKSMGCAVTAQSIGGGVTRYFCKLSIVMHFLPLDLQVFLAGKQIYNRSISIDRMFLLDPPANLTLTRTERPDQLTLSWVSPPLKYMDDSMMYEVNYFMAGSQMGKREVVLAQTKIILRGLQPGTRYEARVRVKFNGITYDGYWSAWTPTVSMETPHMANGLIIGESLLSGVVTEAEGDADAPELNVPDAPDDAAPGCPSGVSGAAAVVGESEARDTTAPRAPSRSSRVLTDAVLQVQRDTIGAINEVAKELSDIKCVLKDINASLKELVNK